MIYFTVQCPKDKHRLMDIPWHFGEIIPEAVFQRSVLKIQADEEELSYLLDCLKPKIKTDSVQSTEAMAQAAETIERDRHADCKAIEAEAWKRVKEYREQRDELADALENYHRYYGDDANLAQCPYCRAEVGSGSPHRGDCTRLIGLVTLRAAGRPL